MREIEEDLRFEELKSHILGQVASVMIVMNKSEEREGLFQEFSETFEEKIKQIMDRDKK